MPPCWGRRTSGPQFSDKGTEVLVPKLCAPNSSGDPAARTCVARICGGSGCKRLRSPLWPAPRAQPAPAAAKRPETPAETRPSPSLRPARSCGRARAAPAAARTRAREPPAPDPLRHPAAAGYPHHVSSPARPRRRRNPHAGGVQDRAAAKPEPRTGGDCGRRENGLRGARPEWWGRVSGQGPAPRRPSVGARSLQSQGVREVPAPRA